MDKLFLTNKMFADGSNLVENRELKFYASASLSETTSSCTALYITLFEFVRVRHLHFDTIQLLFFNQLRTSYEQQCAHSHVKP